MIKQDVSHTHPICKKFKTNDSYQQYKLASHSIYDNPLHKTLGQQNSTIELENQWQKCMTQRKIEVWKIQPFTQKISPATTLANEEMRYSKLNHWIGKIRDKIALVKKKFTNGKISHWTIKSTIEMHLPRKNSPMENSPIELEN